ncbi:MAG: acylphosphatase [Candidatus Omnitrophota bacterium]|nr:MAG: acylphosphatase [Candidatus Omnitrophota bacterium]
MTSRVHLFYSGYVQGVGFRFTTERIALSLQVKGWVRNLRDGRVEIVAEGEKKDLEELMARLRESFSGYIKEVQVTWETPQGEFDDFTIRF